MTIGALGTEFDGSLGKGQHMRKYTTATLFFFAVELYVPLVKLKAHSAMTSHSCRPGIQVTTPR